MRALFFLGWWKCYLIIKKRLGKIKLSMIYLKKSFAKIKRVLNEKFLILISKISSKEIKKSPRPSKTNQIKNGPKPLLSYATPSKIGPRSRFWFLLSLFKNPIKPISYLYTMAIYTHDQRFQFSPFNLVTPPLIFKFSWFCCHTQTPFYSEHNRNCLRGYAI